MLVSLCNKITDLQACNFIKKRLQHRCFFCEYCEINTCQTPTPDSFLSKVAGLQQVFSFEFCEIFKNTYFEKHLRMGASEGTRMSLFQPWSNSMFQHITENEHGISPEKNNGTMLSP